MVLGAGVNTGEGVTATEDDEEELCDELDEGCDDESEEEEEIALEDLLATGELEADCLHARNLSTRAIGRSTNLLTREALH